MTPAKLFLLFATFVILMAPGLAILWLTILRGATFDFLVWLLCGVMFFIGLVIYGVTFDEIS